MQHFLCVDKNDIDIVWFFWKRFKVYSLTSQQDKRNLLFCNIGKNLLERYENEVTKGDNINTGYPIESELSFTGKQPFLGKPLRIEKGCFTLKSWSCRTTDPNVVTEQLPSSNLGSDLALEKPPVPHRFTAVGAWTSNPPTGDPYLQPGVQCKCSFGKTCECLQIWF